MDPKKVAIIGGGNMGASLARCLLHKVLASNTELVIVESDETKIPALKEEFQCSVYKDVTDQIQDCSACIIAVKPQDAAQVLTPLEKVLEKEQLVISLMAGISLENIKTFLPNHRSIVRCMPNLPVQVGVGMTVYITEENLSTEYCVMTERILGAAGAVLRVSNEKLLDAATAVSGTGPGYVFYFIEHIMNAAIELGFTAKEAKLLVEESFRGSIRLWSQLDCTPAQLRQQVTSKGGTTEAAVSVFTDKEVGRAIEQGVKAANLRSEELSKLLIKS